RRTTVHRDATHGAILLNHVACERSDIGLVPKERADAQPTLYELNGRIISSASSEQSRRGEQPDHPNQAHHLSLPSWMFSFNVRNPAETAPHLQCAVNEQDSALLRVAGNAESCRDRRAGTSTRGD